MSYNVGLLHIQQIQIDTSSYNYLYKIVILDLFLFMIY